MFSNGCLQLSTLALVVGLLGACGSKSTVLAIAISNIPVETKTLEVNLTIDGKRYPADPPFQYDAARGATTVLTGIEIPWSFTDRLVAIDMTARGTRCPLASYSSAAATIEPGTYTVSAPLERLQSDEIITDLYTVYAVSPDEVWAGGANQGAARWDGCYWRKHKVAVQSGNPSIVRIYQHPHIGVWAVGGDGLVAHFDESTQTFVEVTAPKELFATATGGKLPQWLDVSYLPGSEDGILIIGAMFTSSPSCFAARGTRSGPDSFSWQIATTICNANAQAVIAGCTGCNFYPHKLKLFEDGKLAIAGAVGTTDSGAMTTTYQGAFVRFADSSLTNPDARVLPQVVGASSQLVHVWGTAASDLWLAGVRLTQVTGSGPATALNLAPQFYNDGSNLYGVSGIWGTANNDFWMIAVNSPTRFVKLHHVTNPFLIDSNDTNGVGNYQLIAVHGSSTSDVWFVGNAGLRIHYDGKLFQVMRDL